jgi:FkbM family methyltransferase
MSKFINYLKNAVLAARYGFRGAPFVMAGETFRVDASLRSWRTGSEEWMFLKMKETLLPGDVFADVGANYGFHTLVAARFVGPTGQVVAFEPVPGNLKLLRKNCALNGYAKRVVIAKTAVSDVPQEFLEMGVSAGGQDVTASLAARDTHGRKVLVPNTALDDYAFPGGGRLSMVKIDVEGAELSVLRSAKRLLAEQHPVLLLEVHRDMLKSFGNSVEELEAFLEGLGYRESARHEFAGSLDHCYHAVFKAQ